MPLKLSTKDAGFEEAFAAFLSARREAEVDVSSAVAEIITAVRARGDAALFDYTQRFDRLKLTSDSLRIAPEEIAAAAASCDEETLSALRLAADRIRSYHEKQLPQDLSYRDEAGVLLGHRWTPVAAVGLYVPGGRAAYPSSLLMNAIPARVAGVARLAVVVPTPDGEINPLVLAAAEVCGIEEVYRVGGAQAVAALAYGTESIAPVDKIVGPGNAYVAEAKRQVFGTVGIDMIAGPSEILVVADRDNDPAWIAADLLSQAEHDPTAQSILLTASADFAERVCDAVERELSVMPRREIAAAAWRDHGAVVTLGGLDEAGALIDRIAPEHLELAVEEPERLMETFSNAGAIFLGRHTPEAVGDYLGGPNHVLPTARSARFSSGLSVFDFLKRSSILGCSAEALSALAPATIALAEAEGLHAHARSVSLRTNRPTRG